VTNDSAPNAWRLPFTVADQSAIDALDPDTRALKDNLEEFEGSIRDLRWKVTDALEALSA
jgi:hypothetical protein